MASVENFDIETRQNTGWLAMHCQVFLETIIKQGYSDGTIGQYRRAILRFRKEVEERCLKPKDLDIFTRESLQEAVVNKTSRQCKKYAKFCINRFIDYLVEIGVLTKLEISNKKLSPIEQLHREYDSYLRQPCGLSESTIYHCIRSMERFISYRFGEVLGDLNAITPDDIAAFLCHIGVGTRYYRNRTVPSHLRNFFKFLFWSGKTRNNLAKAIPHVPHPQPINLPRYLKYEETQQLIDSIQRDDAIGRRNYAMMLLLARLGLRSPEVIAIRLEDIDWRSGEIMIRGKGKLHDRMPLPSDVGKAIVDYIKNGRVGTSRTLFLSSIAPHKPFKNAQILNYVLEGAFKKTGLKPPQKYIGSYLLRHSLATDMLRRGASFDEIGNLLRHRSRMSTTIYAKYDIDALRSIACEWPVKGGVQ